RKVVECTDGVPLFVEEFVRTMVAAPSESNANRALTPMVPESLQDLLMARLDLMGAGKEVAQVAAVIGRAFTRELLQEIRGWEGPPLQHELDTLCRSAVLRPPAEDTNGEYLFQHALLRDAAYLSLLLSRRQQLHASVAGAMTRLYPRL